MDTRIMAVGSAKTKTGKKRRSRVRITGFWLNSIGFENGKLVSAEYNYGNVILKAHDSDIATYESLVNGIRKNKSSLLQVRQDLKNKQYTPHIEIKGFWLENLGFTIGSVIAVQYENGLINIRLLDLSKLL